MTFFKKVVLFFRLVPGMDVSVGGLKLVCTNICLKLYMFFYFRDKFQVSNVTLPDFWTGGHMHTRENTIKTRVCIRIHAKTKSISNLCPEVCLKGTLMQI